MKIKKMPENKDDIDLDGWDIHRAAEENRVDIARALIARGDDVNARGWGPSRSKYADNTALHLAAERDSAAMARFLIEHGADVDAKNSSG